MWNYLFTKETPLLFKVPYGHCAGPCLQQQPHINCIVIYCTVQHGSQAYLYSYTLSWINTCTIQTIHNLHCKFCRMLGISTYTVKSIHNSTLWKLICIHWNTGFLNNTSIRFFFLHISCSRIINNFSSHIAQKFRH